GPPRPYRRKSHRPHPRLHRRGQGSSCASSASGERVPQGAAAAGGLDQKLAYAEVNGMDWLTGFGLFSVSTMLICYALEDHSSWYILAFAGACALGSVYGFLQGAWPFGLVEAVWSLVALRRWQTARAVRIGRQRD